MRHAVILCLGLFIVAPVMAQEKQGPPPQQVLREVLQLTDAQMAALKQLEDARRAAVEPILPQLAQAQQALGAALKAEPADPATVGKAMLAVRDLEQKIGDAQRALHEGFIAMLTDEQRTRVEHIHAVEAALKAGQALHALGL